MATSQPPNKNISCNNNTTKESDRDKINKILAEFGLDSSDYIFQSSQDLTPDHPSVASKSQSPTQTLNFQLPTLITSGRSLSYVQQPPPPPPVINRQQFKPQSPNDMSQQEFSSRRMPPPPPSVNTNTDDSNLNAEYYLNKINSLDNPPVKVVKPNTENLVYRKEIRIRYLQPPTPPPPAPIIIREKQLPPKPPESPLLIRERKPEPPTPPPLTIRERPPTPPVPVEPYIIDKPLPPPPPQPRPIIIERLPTPPPKPRTVIFEKWLPYKKVKRPILLEKAPQLPPTKPTRNVIIEYEPLKAYTVRRVIEEGIFRVDPNQYSKYYAHETDGNVRIVDRIDDLPPPSEELMRVIKNYNQQNSSDYNTDLLSNSDPLMNVTHSSNITVPRQERVRTPGYNSSSPSPTNLQSQFSQLRNLNRSSQHRTPDDSPLTLKPEDVY
ncbi:unnamed protein product [Rotaria sordida]|uniref:Uncharacterized protein n=1 Tax=Rotaria sordida TaxID=392033 RepID=A0A814NPD0_9BILA|nr:unnamed protein product [Rotaria sordida]CAF1156483.1 unnamed protein product [Rotaria sordida]CAF3690436.1 unnamed protein product [Rotaria sordida]CAF3762553.1 unnamed protein product [Rotaria sordida]